MWHQFWELFSCILAPQGRLGSFFWTIVANLYSVRSPKGLLEASGLDFGSICGGFLEVLEGSGVDLGSILEGFGGIWDGLGTCASTNAN